MRHLLLLPLFAAACADGGSGKDDSDSDGGGPAIAGLYRVTGEFGDDTCQGNWAEILPRQFFELRANDDGGVDFYVCFSETDCDEVPDRSWTFAQKGKKWLNQEVWSIFNAGEGGNNTCLLDQRVRTWVDQGDDKIRVDSIEQEDQVVGSNFTGDADCEALLEDWKPSTAAVSRSCQRLEARKVK